MFCEQCGAQVPDGTQFCEQCGAPVVSDVPRQIQQEPIQSVQQSLPTMGSENEVHSVGVQPDWNRAYGNQQYPASKKSPAVPIIIAVVAVAVLGLGGFGVYKAYKNFDKIKGFFGKNDETVEQQDEDVTGNTPGMEEEPDSWIENESVTDDGSANEDPYDNTGINSTDNGTENTDKYEDENDDKVKPGEDFEKPEKTEKELPIEDENRPDIGDSSDYDTSERPAWEEFSWVLSDEMTQGMLIGEDMFSNEAYRLTEYDDIVGGWKGYLCYDPNNTYPENPWGGPVVFLVHAEITGDKSKPTIYFEWLQYRNTSNGEEGKLSSKGTFECNRKSNNVVAGRQENGWHITLDHFCWFDGQEYATGRMKAADGGDCILALFR